MKVISNYNCIIVSILLLCQLDHVYSDQIFSSTPYFTGGGKYDPSSRFFIDDQSSSYEPLTQNQYNPDQFGYYQYPYSTPLSYSMNDYNQLYPSQYPQTFTPSYSPGQFYPTSDDPFASFPEFDYSTPYPSNFKNYQKNESSVSPRTILLDISNKNNTKFVTYSFDNNTNTHIFKANEGYLFEAAIDENAEQVWEPTNNKFADKITVQETGPGDFSIRVFVPIEGTSDSETEFNKQKTYPDKIDKTTKYQKLPRRKPYKHHEQTHKHDKSREHKHNLINIELNDRKTTDKCYYNYDKRYCIHSFKPKTGYNINKVTINHKIEYEHETGNYPDEVIIIELPEGGEVFRIIFPSDKEEKLKTHEKPQKLTKQKLVKVNVKNLASTEEIKYRFDELNKIHRFLCRDNYLIRKIIKDDKTLREFNGPNYPDRLLIIPIQDDKPILRVLYPGQEEGLDNIPGFKPFKKEIATPSPPTDITLISVDVKKHETTDKVEFKQERDGTRIFLCKPGYLIKKVTKGERVLEKFKDEYPNKITVSEDINGKKLVDISFPYEPELITLDIRTKKTTSKFMYERDYQKQRDVYTAIKPYLFYEVRKDNELLWYSRDGRFPEKVLIKPVPGQRPILRVYYPRDAIFPSLKKIPGYMPDKYKPEEFKQPPEPPEPDGTVDKFVLKKRPKREIEIEDKYKDDSKPMPLHKEPVTIAEHVTKIQMPEISVPEADIEVVDTRPLNLQISHPFTLNLKQQNSTDQFTFTSSGHIGCYTANVGYGIDGVNKDNDIIWRSSGPTEYGYKVFADGVGIFSQINNFTLYQINGVIKHYHKYKNHQWISIPPLLELDIEHKSSTLHVNCTTEEKNHIFETNHNFTFTKVFEGHNLIWDSLNLNKCHKVCYRENIKNESHDKEVTIFLDDGTISLRKDKSTQQWVDLASTEVYVKKEETTHKTEIEIMRDFNENEMKIYTIDPNDVTLINEHDISQYEKSVESEEYTYTFKDDAKCVEVKYKDKTLWNYDYNIHGGLYPKKIHFQKELLLIVIDFGSISHKYKFDGDNLNLVYMKKPNLIEIDLEKDDGISQGKSSAGVSGHSDPNKAIHREVKNGLVIYTSREHHAINPIKYGNDVLLNTTNPFDYVVQIKAKPETSPERFSAILLNGKIKNFSKSTQGGWTELSSDIHMFN